jgi:hypothetical protein
VISPSLRLPTAFIRSPTTCRSEFAISEIHRFVHLYFKKKLSGHTWTFSLNDTQHRRACQLQMHGGDLQWERG